MSASPRLSTGALSAWRLLRDRGGYWSAAEVAAELLGDGSTQNSCTASHWLLALWRRWHVVLNKRPGDVPFYGVTARCRAPKGESLHAPPPAGAA